jgi:hypothetical protein
MIWHDLFQKPSAPVHPIDSHAAKRWVKGRLKRLFPELRSDPEALERAYRELGLEAREGSGRGAGVVYEITLPSAVWPDGKA